MWLGLPFPLHIHEYTMYSGGSRNFEKGGGFRRGGPPLKNNKNSGILGLKSWVLLILNGKYRATALADVVKIQGLLVT
jgi:hypothetical protein